MTAKEYLEKEEVWRKIPDDNITKIAFIQMMEVYAKDEKIRILKKILPKHRNCYDINSNQQMAIDANKELENLITGILEMEIK